MTNQPESPALSNKLVEIILLLLKFRFINRIQFQTLLHHKNHSRLLLWLTYLTEHGYINKYYDKTFAGGSAVYSLGTTGRTYLKKHPEVTKGINLLSLDRVWREKNNSLQFRNRWLFLVDVYLSLVGLTTKTMAELHFSTKTDLYGMDYMVLPLPDAYFAIVEKDKTIKRYFLDILPDVRAAILRKRIRQYVYYYDHNYWQDHTNKPFPEIILVFPTVQLKNQLYYAIRKKLELVPDMNFYLTTRDLIKSKGLCREALQKVELPD